LIRVYIHLFMFTQVLVISYKKFTNIYPVSISEPGLLSFIRRSVSLHP